MTQKELKKLLRYNPRTGIFKWLSSRPGVRSEIAGGKVQSGGVTSKSWYIGITINYRRYMAHRLAFLYMTGRMPVRVDHENHSGLDNRWHNLREVSEHGNNLNKRLDERNTSGICGLHWHKNRWVATIQHKGMRRQLGRFTNKREAAKARRQAERELGFHRNHGRALSTK